MKDVHSEPFGRHHGVFVRAGVSSIEGNLLNTWLPGPSGAAGYLAVSVALFRARNPVEQAEPGFG